uniref:Integrase, catalytic region, zinc finger, CCHC-type, peptidase aspartic, catalytic n=1 Tax=Tanacetum cinerariifolium TaxID=118510 RepID=A0A6L2K6C6_TANCI|nr:hypothetical protein [Tanacetum cinerariifolium]
MELYMMNRQHGRMILESVENGPLIWPTIEENEVTRPRKYSKLTPAKALQADCDVKAKNIILQGLPNEIYALVSHHKVAKDLWKESNLSCKEREGYMSKQCTKPKRKQDDLWFKDKVMLVQAQANGQILHEEELAFLADPGIPKVALMANLSHYGSDTLAEVHNPDNVNNDMTNQVNCIEINLENKNINDTLTAELERYKEQVKVLKEGQIVENSVNSLDPTPSNRPTKVEVPKELPKVDMVNTSLKKLKHHLVGFDVVVKERTTATTITEGTWGFEHTKAYFRDEIIPFVKALKDLFNTFDQFLIDGLSEVQNVFHQIEQVVEQHRLESKTFEVKMNQLLNENERLLEQVINKYIMNIVVSSTVDNASVNVHECEKCLKLETELLNKKDFIEKETYDKLFRTLKDDLRKLKGKALVDDAVTSHSITPKMLKVDVEPLAPKLLNNRTAHSDYLRHTQEQAAILKKVVEQGKS